MDAKRASPPNLVEAPAAKVRIRDESGDSRQFSRNARNGAALSWLKTERVIGSEVPKVLGRIFPLGLALCVMPLPAVHRVELGEHGLAEFGARESRR